MGWRHKRIFNRRKTRPESTRGSHPQRNTKLDGGRQTHLSDAAVGLAVALRLEGRMAGDELEAEHAQRPQVHPLPKPRHIMLRPSFF
jgi:hypothetical protein